ncbi:ring finger domain containing protein [Nitzschia inconspicua]|uniref:Ring finger domain containing protein n=1 Tax=Nitzschia inconspicua TaxID=303405 RepID=A0A9K3KRL8_9STRA|nr:ring finger domain containing protein [Nitzschia inconspicua]
MPKSAATRQNTALNSHETSATATVRAMIIQRQSRNGRSTARRSSSSPMDLVAQEIETVIFGESDDEIDNDEFEEDSSSEMEEAEVGLYRTRSTGCDRDGLNFGSRRRRNRSDPASYAFFDGEEVNTYGLFDDPHQRRHRRFSKRVARSSSSGSIIYAQKYKSPATLFMPILIFLGATFAALLVIRLLTGLLTAAVGMVIIFLFAIRLVQEFLTRPIRFIRNLHGSPVICFAAVGAIVGTIHALWVQQLFPLSRLLVNASVSQLPERLRLGLPGWFGVQDNATSANDHDVINVNLVVLWGLLRGLGYGIEIGSLWLILLGRSSKSTALGQNIYTKIWRPLKRHYRNSAKIRESEKIPAITSPGHRANTVAYRFEDDQVENRNRCAICLENFDNTIETCLGKGSRDDDFPPPDQYQLLPCNHYFHRECARNWLTIQQSCPICRIKVEGMRGCGTAKKAIARDTS